MNKSRFTSRSLALLSLALLAGNPLPLAARETTDASPFSETETQLINAVDPAYIESIVQYIHNNIGGRTAGGYTDRASASYFADQFAQLDYAPFDPATSLDGTADYFEHFESPRVQSRTGAVIQSDERIFDAVSPNADPASVYKGETDGLQAEAIFIENADDAAAAPAEQVAGKIVVTYRKPLDVWNAKSSEYASVVRAMEANGAAGVVFIFPKYTVNEDGKVSSSRYPLAAITEGEEIHIPVLLTPYLEGKQIVRKITSSACCATLTLASKANTVTSNILAVKEAAVPSDEYVLIGAHRDSVFGAEGVNDNLSGTANVLGIAKALQNIDTDTNIIFALWGAEEDGLQGSKAFYNEVLAPENWGKEHITAYYNLDMAAPAQQRNRVLTIHTPYKDEAGNPLQSPAGDLAESNVARLYSISDLAGTTVWSAGPDDAADLQYFGNCSDHASISGANASPRLAYGEGIPSVYMFWGDRIGDGRNDVTEQNYHVPGDIYQWPADEDIFTAFGDSAPFSGNYDIRRAKILADVFALSVYNTADYPDLPAQDSVVSGDLNLNLPKIWSASVTLDKQPVELVDGEVLSLAADDRTHTLELTDTFGRSVSSTFRLESARAAALRQAADEAAAIAPKNNGVFDPASKGALDAALSSARTLLESDAIVPEQIDDALKAIDDAKNSLGYRLFRVYNRNNGEHLYTIDRQEADALIDLGWSEEGVAWIAPVFGRALIRLYNPNSGEHHYTADPDEISYLKSIGWQDEGEKWNSADSQSGVSIHRLYNPNAKGAQAAGAHHYTLSTKEKDALVRFGWNYENNDKAKIYALKG